MTTENPASVPTPRTDRWIMANHSWALAGTCPVRMAVDFARTLETELAASAATIARLEGERDEAKASEARCVEFCVGLSLLDPNRYPEKLFQASQKISSLKWQEEQDRKSKIELAAQCDALRRERDELCAKVENTIAIHANAEEWILKQQEALVTANKENGVLLKRIETMGKQLDALLNHCPDAECSECAKIICPHGEPFHFHHDGCPSCGEPVGDDDPQFAPAP